MIITFYNIFANALMATRCFSNRTKKSQYVTNKKLKQLLSNNRLHHITLTATKTGLLLGDWK